MWESHADTDTRRFSKLGPDRPLPIYTVDASSGGTDDRVVAAVTSTQPVPDRLESWLRRLLVPPPPPKPVPSVLEQLLQQLLTEAQAPQPAPPTQTGHSDIESLLQRLLPGTFAPTARTQPGPTRRNWTTVVCFSCGKAVHGVTRSPDLDEAFPLILPGSWAEKVCYDFPPGWRRSGAGRETPTDPGWGAIARISNGTRPQDPGGGQAWLTASRDMAVARPVFQPIVSDSVMVVMEVLRQDVQACLRSGPPLRNGDTGAVEVTFDLVGTPATAFLSDADGCANFAGGVAVAVTPPTILADEVAVGVTLLAVAGAASPADLAGVVAADVTTLADV